MKPRAALQQFRYLTGGFLLTLVLMLVYLPAIRGGYLWDDHLLITDNPLVSGSRGLAAIWTGASSMDYTPLTTTVFWLEWRLWGGNPVGFHLVNILLHVFSACVLWRVLEKLAVPGAGIGAILFALHPVTVASVAWISELKNGLSLLFYLVAILCFLEESAPWIVWLAAACAFLSKGSTVVLPAILLACALWKRRKITRRDLLVTAPVVAAALLAAWATIHFQAQIISSTTAQESLAFRLIRAGDAVWLYLWKDVLPLNITAIYPVWEIRTDNLLCWLPGLLLIAGLALPWVLKRPWSAAIRFASGCFLLALLPALGLLSMGFLDQAYIADWWQELALPAVAALAGAGLGQWWNNARLRPAAIGVTGLVCAFFVYQSSHLAGNYRSEEVFWRQALAGNPDAWGAEDNLGNLLQDSGQWDAAIQCYRASLKINPAAATTYLDLGNAFQKLGKMQEAADAYTQAAGLHPDDAVIQNNLGVALNATGDHSEAASHYREAVRLNPNYAPAHNNLGLLYQAEGSSKDAMGEYETALQLDNGNPETHYNYACALQAAGNINEAIGHFQKAIALKVNYVEARNDLGNALRAAGRTDEATAQYQAALQLDPQSAFACMNLGAMLVQQGKISQGLDYLRKGAGLQPASPQAQWSTGAALLKTGSVDEAMTYLRKAVECYSGNPEAYLELAALLDSCKAYPQESVIYKEAIARNPKSAELSKAYSQFLANGSR